MNIFTFSNKIGHNNLLNACSFLAEHTQLSKMKVKDAMNKGAVWIKRTGRKNDRLRKAKANLSQGDIISIFYDSDNLSMSVSLMERFSSPFRILTQTLSDLSKLATTSGSQRMKEPFAIKMEN